MSFGKAFDKKEQTILRNSLCILNKKKYKADVKASIGRIISIFKKHKPAENLIKMNNFASAQFTQDPKTVIKSLALRSKVLPQNPRFLDQTNRSNTIRRIIWRAVKELDRKMRNPIRCIFMPFSLVCY